MDRNEKIHVLHKLLIQSKYPVHIKKIIEEMACSEKTFFRIRRKLEELYGLEIENCNEHYYKYKTDDGQPEHFPGLWFTHTELEALICFINALNSIQAGILDDIMRPFKERLYKLLDAHDITGHIWNTSIKTIPLAQRTVKPEILKTITDSVLRNKRCCIVYKALTATTPQQRDISPQTLLRYRDNWYVDAWCHSRNALRTFALSRISHIEQTTEDAKLLDREMLDQHYTTSYGIFSGTAKETAIIRFTGIAAQEVSHEEWHPAQKTEWLDDTTLQFTIPFCDATELIMDILRWGDMAEVIQPASLREKIIKIFENCSKKYASRRN